MGKKSGYQRVTRTCSWSDLRPELTAAIRAHVERHARENILTDIQICCETISTKEKKSLFGKRTEVEIGGAVLTGSWLLWAGGKENEPIGVLSARLTDLRVQDYEKTKMYQMLADTGLQVDGFREGDSLSSIFIGLGPGTDGQQFREMLKEVAGS